MRGQVLISALMMLGAVGCSSAVGQSSTKQAQTAADAQEPSNEFRAHLRGFQEVPAISTPATGEFRATLNAAGTEIAFEFSWSNLTPPILFSHVHFGQFGVNGGVSYFLCGEPGHAGTLADCPQQASATIKGTVTAADVKTILAQGMQAGRLDQILAAMRAGIAYANIHTQRFPGGEMRGQINFGDNNVDDGAQ